LVTATWRRKNWKHDDGQGYREAPLPVALFLEYLVRFSLNLMGHCL
jgi:hypothetical protein